MSERAIGIFDSGVGGLTVFKEVRRLLSGEQLIYLGDTARVPYGTKSPRTVLRYSLEAAAFLDRQRVKLLVVACNTASAVALDELEERFSLPVVGVIEPGARRAAAVTRNRRVGVIGTEGTIKSGAYTRAIHALDPGIEVHAVACPLFVPLTEEGWAEHPVARLVASEYLAPLLERDIDTLVLGCTHYPLLKSTLHQVLGEGIELVDSAEQTALRVSELLTGRGLCRRTPPDPSMLFVTDVPTRFERVGGSFLGAPLRDVMQVELDDTLPPATDARTAG
ncbi:MAG: glutamate racemase [Desulfuromonas sp.]|uniref:glutamate racemase n=1 Tax=Desulfuromonas sp. TaxID=892 RepID=UPI000CA6F232|nr:glutamate racemase [Desulfuromonas sp.]PLX82361.1 MAG: glutamate racemase [Desulfuromonas sp.]